MNRHLFLIIVFCIGLNAKSQVGNYNQFPMLPPAHLLDNPDLLPDLNFAYSMRILESDYEGPLVRLRRASDNAEEDFFCGPDDKVNTNAINTWRNGSNVFLTVWYDQSNANLNAVQTDVNRQPRFYPDPQRPYFRGDGINDHLIVDTPNGIQDVTNNGNQGTVITTMVATRKSQHSFGVLTNSDRWSVHINWGNNNLYFDPGICCNDPRTFNNGSGQNQWASYTFIKTASNAVARMNAVERFNGTHTTGRCTRTENFAIGWATGNQSSAHATTSFNELIMYKTDISAPLYTEIEDNQITFWEL